MAFAFLGFLIARPNNRGYVWPILVMAFAGFIKHNIIAMPLSALLWLGLYRRREAAKCFCVAAMVIITGTTMCYAVFGQNFFLNILSPRHYSLKSALGSFGKLESNRHGWYSIVVL